MEGGRAVCEIGPSSDPIFGSPQKETRTLIPDFLIIRNTVRRLRDDFRNILYGFLLAGVPSVNSLMSIVSMQERPVMMSELYRLKKKLGSKNFPVIDQMYFNNKDIIKKPIYDKCVLKVGPGHAGYGKIKVTSTEAFDDAASIIQLYPDYFTAEPFIDYKYDLRIQKIGNHYRGFKRESTIGSWKANVGIPKVEDFELEKKHIVYIEEASKLFGGLDICALDVLGDTNGNEFILELNDTAIGLNPTYQVEDTERIVELAIEKMNEIFC